MPKESLTAEQERWPGTVRVTVAGTGRRLLPRVVRITVIALTAVLASAGVVLGIRALDALTGAQSGPRPAALDARSATASPNAPGEGAVPGSSRLALLGPLKVLDTRGGNQLLPGALAPLALPVLPPGSTAVLLEVSLVAATGPGAVTIRSGTDEIPALRLPRAGTMTTATLVVPAGQDRELQVRTEGGGHLLIQLLGAFEPAQAATSGRLVPVPATRVLDLMPATDGKDATIDLAAVPALRGPGQVAAVLLQVAADVGRNGGSVTVDGVPGGADQRVFWMATTGTDRTRTGLLLVPISGTNVSLHYEAGTQLRADLVGYVTGQSAPQDEAGLLVPVQPQPQSGPVTVSPGKAENLTVVTPASLAGVPAGRVAAVLIGVGATGEGPGGITVYTPGSAEPGIPTLTAAPGALRSALALVATVDGAVRISTESGALVSINLQALILGQ